MGNSDTMATAIAMLNEHQTLLPGTHDYDFLANHVSMLIDPFGLEKALEQVRDAKFQLLAQIEQMCT